MIEPSRHSGTGSRESIATPEDQDLVALVARLGDGIVELFEGKIALLKLDVEEAVGAYERKATTMAFATFLAGVGVALGGCGLAFALAYFLPARLDALLGRAIAFGTVGAIATIVGVVVLRRSSRVSRRDNG